MIILRQCTYFWQKLFNIDIDQQRCNRSVLQSVNSRKIGIFKRNPNAIVFSLFFLETNRRLSKIELATHTHLLLSITVFDVFLKTEKTGLHCFLKDFFLLWKICCVLYAWFSKHESFNRRKPKKKISKQIVLLCISDSKNSNFVV